MNKKNSHENVNKNFNPKDFLISLDSLPFLETYQELGFTLKSLCKVTQTAIMMDISYSNLSEHNLWDIFNILNLMRKLIPEAEFELLDIVNKQ